MSTLRSFVLPALFIGCAAFGQSALVGSGAVFSRTFKNIGGDQHQVISGLQLPDGNTVMYVVEGGVHKVIKLNSELVPSDEVPLQAVAFDGATWTGVAPLVVEGTMHCLLVSQGKKTADYAIGVVEARGAPALGRLRRIASSELAHSADPAYTLASRPLPDPILSNKGLLFAQQERIIAAADAQHFLLSNYSVNDKGAKRFWFAYLDKEFTVLWSGVKELPYADSKSRIHQIQLTNDGSIQLLSYVFGCASEEQMRDKLCHELHLTTLSERGNAVNDVLIDKDFVSTARMCPRDSGKVSMAIRYGALTGQPGLVLTFDPKDPKLKSTPVVDQRVPSIYKTKLMAYGSIEAADQKKTPSRTAKVPDEIVTILPAWNNGLLVVETFLDEGFQVPMDGAIAMRRLSGDIRTSLVGANDTVLWQQVTPRAFMTTAGRDYEGVYVELGPDRITLMYDHTPRGLDAILKSGIQAPDAEASEGKGKKAKVAEPVEAGVLKAVTLDPSGAVVTAGTALLGNEGMIPCPSSIIQARSGTSYLVKSFDRNTSYRYSLTDLSKMAE